VLGATNEASSATSIVNTSAGGSGDPEVGILASGDIGVQGSGTTIGVRGEGHRGVEGYSEDGAGVVGTTESGAGVSAYAPMEHGWTRALVVQGRAHFTRSGRVTIPAGTKTFDIDFRSTHGTYLGLEGTPLCFANLMSYRPGVFVTTMRPNYPIPGKARIYLNIAPSSPAYVAWVVLDS
jgi:hypothetical protein